MVELRAVAKSFRGPAPRRIFADLSLSVARGEYVAIVGASGVGKSTLLNIIAGLEPVDAGAVIVDGVDCASLDDDAKTAFRRDRMGFVFQAFHVLPYLSVADNVALPLALQGERTDAQEPRVAAMLRAVGLDGRERSRPRELSGGELQRVAIARALVHRPALVLADEPTGNLDPATAAQVLALLRDAVKRRRRRGGAGDAFARCRRLGRPGASADGRRPAGGVGRRHRMTPYRFAVARAVSGGVRATLRGRTLLAVVAIAFGIALGYAVELINRAAVGELTAGLAMLAGDADLEVRGPRAGFDETLYPALARDADVAVASPVVEADVKLRDRREPLTLLGVDAFRAAAVSPALVPIGADRFDALRGDTLFPSAAAAQWLGVDVGDTVMVQVGLREIALRVAGHAGAGGAPRYAVMDIAAAQDRFDRDGRLTRIDLRLRPGADVSGAQRRLQALLPPGVHVAPPHRPPRRPRAFRARIG